MCGFPRNILISHQRTLPNKTINNCFERGKKKFLGELNELRNFKGEHNLKLSCWNSNYDLPKQLRCIPLNKFLIFGRKFNLFFETVFSRFTSLFSHKRTAFTLAEVLITLGIIGIVASLTLPSVINNYKRKQLEVAFKRSSSTLMNALNQTAIEAGYSNYRDLIVCDFVVQDKDSASCVLGNQELFKELNAIFESKLNIVKKISWYDLQNSNKFSYQTYNGAKNFNYNFLYGMKRDNSLFILNDGTAITPISFHTHNPHEISLSFDTNGLNKGPNRLGYDVFIFTTAWNLLCAKENSQTGYGLDTEYNGRGCYNYAIKNINPDDRTKGYWESLYK